MIVGIDASNIRAGGGLTHLVELLRATNPKAHNFSQIIVWSGQSTLAKIEDRSWLIKSYQPILDKGLFYRIFWQRFRLSNLARSHGCDVLFVPGGSYAGDFHPMVTLSQNLLPFEWKELQRFRWSLMTLKMLFLRWSQSRTFHLADGLIFLTQYAHDVVMRVIKSNNGESAIVPHGIEKRFFSLPNVTLPLDSSSTSRPFRLLYVSILYPYKHQCQVAEAVASLRNNGVPIEIDFVGPSYPPTLQQLSAFINRYDPSGEYLRYRGAISFKELHAAYKKADAFVFASSCENLPNILIEAMAAGLPIACSNKGPMPEVLGDAGIYFDPEKPTEIALAISLLIDQPELRNRLAWSAYRKAETFSWERCAAETFSFITKIVSN